MSKVVHLSDDAHARAKSHCQRAGLKMSEWVAALIERATAERPAQIDPAGDAAPPVPPTKVDAPARRVGPGVRAAAGGDEPDAALPLYAAPPFWARSSVAEAPPLGAPRGGLA